MIRKDITESLQPNWKNGDWTIKRQYLKSIFTQKDIANASRQNLEEFLIVLANTIHAGDARYKEETECFASVVRHLLQVCIEEELHQRSVRVSWFAIGISILALALSGWHEWRALDTSPTVVRPSAPVVAPATPKP
jgi:hypothetical protein